MDSILNLIIYWKEKFDCVVENGEQGGGASMLEVEADRLLSRASHEIEVLSGESLERFYKIERLEAKIEDLKELFEDKADAEYFTDSPNPVPNDAMRAMVIIEGDTP